MKLPVDDSLKALAARSIRRQIRQLTAQFEGIRDAEDIEPVHQARVASRRLRTALSVFADLFGSQRIKAWRREIGRTARDLGDARDKDVQIEFLCDTLAQARDKSLVPGIARVLARCEKRRGSLQPEIVRSLKRLLAGRTLHQVLDACKSIAPRSSKGKTPRASPAVFLHAEEHILARFEDLWAFRHCLADQERCEEHHAMRIAAKRLRYTLEIYRGAYRGRLDAALDVMKQVQSYLGDLHDCDVWVGQLGKMLRKEDRRVQKWFGHPGPVTRLEPGIEDLRENRRARREELFRSLVRYWTGLTVEGFWDELIDTVRQQASASAAPLRESPSFLSASRGRILRWRAPADGADVGPKNGAARPVSERAGGPLDA